MEVYTLNPKASDDIKNQVCDLFLSQISVENTEQTAKKVLSAMHLILEEPSTGRIIVVEHNGEILGLAQLNVGISLKTGGHYIWLNELLVKKEDRNKGIGKKLLIYIIHWAEAEGIRNIELETGVNNTVTKHLYNSLGFYEVVSKRYGFSF